MISAALKMCRTAVNQTRHASKRRIFFLSEGELYICEKEAERCAFRFFCFCFGHCRRSGTRRKLVFVVASPKPNACCKRSALVHFRSSTLAANGFRWRTSKVRPHPGSLRSLTSGLSEGMPASPAQGKACTIPCVPATNEAACIRQVPSQRVEHRVSAKLHPLANQSTVSPPGFPTRVPRFGCTEKSLHRSGFFSCVSGRIRSNHVESSRIRPLNFCYASVQKRRATSAAVAASAV